MKIIALLYILSLNVYTPDISQVRSLYAKAPGKEKHCKELLNLLKPVNEKQHPVLAGYKGCATMIMAKHVLNPFSKLSYFNDGKKILERAISSDTSNIELRYLRYTVQTNAPAFLGYKNKIRADRVFLQRTLPQIKDTYLSGIITKALKDQ